MPYEMYELIKSFSCTLLKNTPGFKIKCTISVAGVCLFLTVVKGNSCLFETWGSIQFRISEEGKKSQYLGVGCQTGL